MHPEVSFRALIDRPVEHSKKTWTGHHLRLSALTAAGIVIPRDLGDAGSAATDDILDAAVAAWSANRYAVGESKHLEPLTFDSGGRAVAIWY